MLKSATEGCQNKKRSSAENNAMRRVEEKNSEEIPPLEVNDVADNGSRRQEVLW